MHIHRLKLHPTLPVLYLAVASMLLASCGLALDSQAKLERGQEAYDSGEYRAAIIDAKAVLQEEPDNLEARLLLGKASVGVGDGAAAEKELRRAIELGANRADVIVDLGRSMLQQGKFEDVLTEIDADAAGDQYETAVIGIRADALLGSGQPAQAREMYRAVIEANGPDLDAQLGVVNTYIAERNAIQARETLDHVLLEASDFIPALQLSGLLALQAGDDRRAIVDFGRAAEVAKKSGDTSSEVLALYGQVDALFIKNKVDDVRPILTRMEEIAPKDVRTMMTTARIAVADNQLTTAQETLQQILRRAPEFRAAQLLLGAVHKENGNLGQAEMYLAAVVAAAPENANARRLLAETRLQLNKAEEARQALQPLTSGPTSDVASLSIAAGASLSLGEIDEAIELLERGIAADSSNIELKLQLAQAYLRDGKFDDARLILDSLPDLSGERNEFRHDILRVLTSMGQGDQTKALSEARAVREEWPGRADAHSLVGWIEFAAGDLDSARASFERGLDTVPEDVRNLRYLAQLDIREGDFESAKSRYLIILEVEPNDTRSMLALARLAARAEKHSEAREWLEKARVAHPESVSARALLASHLFETRDFAAAERVANEALQLSPKDARLHNLLGLARLYRENFSDAVFSFGEAAKLDPDEPTYHLNLARAQLARGNKGSAATTLDAVPVEALQHLPSALLLASLKAGVGNLSGAMSVSQRLLEMHPDDARPLALQAELLAREGDLDAAADAYDSALDIEIIDRFAIRAFQLRRQAGRTDKFDPLIRYLDERPLDTNVRFFLAQAYQESDEIGKANAQYEQVLSLDPDNYIAANNLAWNYFMEEDGRAEELARRAYDLQPDSGSVADTLGWILVRQGKVEEGVSLLRSAVSLSNGSADIRYHLAAALVELGESVEAKSMLEELLSTKETFSSRAAAEELLEKLGS